MRDRVIREQIRARVFGVLRPGQDEARTPRPPRSGEAVQLYLHVPFCIEPCAFCSFNRVRYGHQAAVEYFAALREEIASYARKGFAFGGLYIGGGTPTILPRELYRTMDTVMAFGSPRVVSVETDVEHLDDEICGALADHGVNRLSIGVQSFQPEVLRALGRRREGLSERSVQDRLARAVRLFRTVNVDMIFGVPGQSLDMVEKDIETLSDILPDQITWYPLLSSHGGHEASQDPPRGMHDLIDGSLGRTYRRSTAWCYSREEGVPLDEYIGDGRDYAGLGAGSFGYIDGVFYATTFQIQDYVRRAKAGEIPVIVARRFPIGDRVRYYLLMRLFQGGVDLREVASTYGWPALAMAWKELFLASTTGLVRLSGRFLRPTRRGRFAAVLAMTSFFGAVSDLRDACRALGAPTTLKGGAPS